MADRQLQRVLQMKGVNVFQSSGNSSSKKGSFIWIVLIIILVCVYLYYNPSLFDLVLDWFESLK